MKTSLFIIIGICLALLMGCKSVNKEKVVDSPEMSEREQQVIDTMQWVDSSDPTSAARQGSSTAECIYLAGNNRNVVYLPGLEKNYSEKVIAAKQYKILEGMGDLIVGQTHKKYRTKTRSYMTEFNQELAKHCNQ